MTQATRALSDAVTMRIREQQASRQFNYRKEQVAVIMKQNGCSVDRAIEIFKSWFKEVPDDVLADLESIRKEMARDGKASAV